MSRPLIKYSGVDILTRWKTESVLRSFVCRMLVNYMYGEPKSKSRVCFDIL